MCTACARDVKGVIYCEDCIAAHVSDSIPAPAVGKRPRVEDAPNSVLATLLGFIPGVGAMYNGQFSKAFVHILIFASLIWVKADVGGSAEAFFGVMIFGFYCYMVFDAYKTARAKELGEPPPDLFGFDSFHGEQNSPASARTPVHPHEPIAMPGTAVPPGPRHRVSPVGALILIGIGVIFLLYNLGLFRFGWMGSLWPVILIGAGIWLYARRRPGCACGVCRTRHLMGPAVLVTLGALFLLENIHPRSFHHTWPLLLIVIGAVKIIQNSASREGHIGPPPGAPPVEAPPDASALVSSGSAPEQLPQDEDELRKPGEM
jgi:hypothetical protein